MSFGLTENGFVIKRLNDIKTELESAFRTTFGEIQTGPDSVFGQIIGILSSREADWWERLQEVYDSKNPKAASGVALDEAVALTGTIRQGAQPANAVVVHEGTEGTLVPSGTQVSDPTLVEAYTLQTSTTITKNNLHKALLTIDSDTEASYSVTVNGVVNTFTLSGGEDADAIAVGLRDEINTNLGSVLTAIASTNIITIVTDDTDDLLDFFTIDAVGTDVSISELWTPALYESVNNGDINSAIGAIDTIDTPVAGLNQVDNLSAAFGGTDTDTDDELRLRQQNELLASSTASLIAIKTRLESEVDNVTQALVFENSTDAIDGEGRPPHSIEAVVDGGLDQDIANKLFEVKAAGIQTFGSESQTVTDPNGDLQSINFSRPVDKNVWLEIDITQNTEETLPTDFASQITEVILEQGATQEIGEDVILQKYFGPIFNNIQGIATIVIRAGFSASPIATNNLIIASKERAKFDAARILVADVT